MKSKYDKFETIQERIDRLQDYYDDPNNGLNKCFIVQKIKELKQRQYYQKPSEIKREKKKEGIRRHIKDRKLKALKGEL